MQSAQRKFDYTSAPYAKKKRTVNMRGNVAYINNNNFLDVRSTPWERPRPAAKQPERLTQNTVTLSSHKTDCARKEGKGLASTLTVLFIAFCALALLVSRHAEIVQIGLKNNQIMREISKLETKAEDLKLDLELRSTLESVQTIARQQLGMTYPLENQRIFIDLNGR